MTLTIRLNDQDASLIKAYAKANNRAVSEIMRNFTLEKIEDELDLQTYIQAMAMHVETPQTSTFDEVWNEINE